MLQDGDILQKLIDVQSFFKGINQSMDRQLISVDEAHTAQNCDVSDGNLRRAKGFERYVTSFLTKNIETILKYFSGLDSVLVIACNGTLYKINGGVYTDFMSGLTSNKIDYVNYQSSVLQILIFGNGLQNTKVYDGTTLRDLKHDGAASVDSDTNKAPKGSLLEIHKERLFISGDSAAPDRIYFSDSFDPEDFTAPVTEEEANQHGGFLDLPTWDGGHIVSIKSLFDQLMIFKRKNIFRLYGTYPGNFEVTQVFNTVNGEIIDRTISAFDDKAYWVSTEGIYEFSGLQSVNLTPRIKDIFNSINKEYIKNATAIVFKNKYYISVPVDSSTTNNLVIEYDITLKNFMVRKDINASCFIELDGQLLFSTNAGSIFIYDSGGDYNGNLINSTWESGDITLGTENKKKFIQKLCFIGSGNGTIRITLNSESNTVYKDIVLSSTEQPYAIRIKNKGKIINFKIENLNGCDFVIKQPQFIVNIPR